MLSRDETEEIKRELEKSPTKQAASIEALKIVQRHRGWISDQSLADLSEYLGLSEEALDAVATYYNLIFRREVGRHQIFLCDSMSCWVMGYMNVRREINKRLGIDFGQTTADGRFTLLPIVCLGVCDHAPAMMVDAEVYWDLTPDKIDIILESYKLE